MPDRTWRPWRAAWTEALYGEQGFYRRPEGPRGHFETSANAGGGGAELFAQALLTLARRHGCRQIVDLGAGRGELLQALLARAGAGPGAGAIAGAETLRLVGVDVVARPSTLPPEVGWLSSPGGAELPDELADLRQTLVIAHEWLDVVPCDVLEVDGDHALRVVEVAVDGSERLGAHASPEQQAWCARWWPLAGAPVGARAEVGLSRDAAWTGLLDRVRSGLVVAVDYGHVAADRPPLGTLAAHRDGHLVPPLADGSCDLTADVAWDSLVASRPSPAAPAMRQRRVTFDGPLPHWQPERVGDGGEVAAGGAA
ncbi:MAG: SAM-dependent methyltransferase, partial [Actinomycetota bacterium]|nr:SAM-dependent methyltransferase [Actinomycetota bacterium]